MDEKIFPTGNQLPPLVHDLVKENGVEAMTPGETAWTVPWALKVEEDGTVSLGVSMVERGKGPGGTVTLKVVSDFDGIYVDATALSREDIQRYFQSRDPNTVMFGGGDTVFKPVGGVMYPLIKNTEGLDPESVKKFNQEQRGIRKLFSEYYLQSYKQDYVFAEEEVSRPWRPLVEKPLGQVATGQKRRGWGRRH